MKQIKTVDKIRKGRKQEKECGEEKKKREIVTCCGQQ